MPSKKLRQNLIWHCLSNIRQLTGYFPYGLLIAVVLRTGERLLQLSPLGLVLMLLLSAPQADLIAWSFPLLFFLMFLLARKAQLVGFSACYAWLADYRDSLIDHLRSVPIVKLNQQASANVAEPLTADINQLENALSHQLVEFLSSWLVVVSSLLLLALFAPLAALGFGVVIVFLLGLMSRLLQRFRQVSEQKKQAFMQGASEFEDLLSGILCLRTFRTVAWRASRLKNGFNQLYKTAMQVEIAGAMPTLLVRFGLELSLVILLYLAFSSSDYAEPTNLICLVILGYFVVDLAQELTTQLTMLNYGMQSEERLAAISNYTLLSEPQNPKAPKDMSYHIEQLSYCYAGTDKPQLHDLSCYIEAGKTTAIIGHSAAGKSTLLNLLARFDRPNTGVISLGGCDLEHIGSQQLYQHIGMVVQDVQLVDGSIRDNILLADEKPDQAWFTKVCELSGCNLIAARLPQGLDNPVGEHGTMLSGGERQSIALARALLKNPDIILLDEATASMDPELQQQVLEGIDHLCQGKTLIVVAHRLHTIQQANKILLLEKGRLIEQGTHEELLENSVVYRALLNCL